MTSHAFAACTVITKNRLAYARVLAASFLHHHPDTPFFVLLVDRVDGYVSLESEPFEVLTLESLGIADIWTLCFQYNAFELACAVKPHLLRALLDQRGFSKVVYLDADILLLESLTEVVQHLDRHSIILTPHLTVDLPNDNLKPTARDILDSGNFNGGFIAVGDDPPARQFLDWIASRLQKDGLADLSRGQFVDQRWLSLVPGLFKGVHVLRHPGHNAGYWRLPGCRIEEAEGNRILIDEIGRAHV